MHNGFILPHAGKDVNARRRKGDGSYEEGETVDVEGTVVENTGSSSSPASSGSEQASSRGGSRGGNGEKFRALKAREAASKASTQ